MKTKRKKKGLRCKTSWCSVLSPKVCDDQKKKKKKKKVFAYQSVGFRSQKKKKNKMVTPEAGRPTPSSDATVYPFIFCKKFQHSSHRRSQDFWLEGGGGANHKSHAMTSSEICKKGTFCNTKISQNGRSEVVVRVWHINRILLKGEEDLSWKLESANV